MTLIKSIIKKIYCILLQILPALVIAHYNLRVFVLRHHPHLPVCKPRLQRPSDGRPAQVMR